MINTSKRDLQMLRYFGVGMILSHPIFMTLNYLNTIGYHIASINISSLNKFTAFGLIATYLGVYFNKLTIPSYIKEKINKKIKILYFFNILIIAYPFVFYKLFHIKSVFISFLIMEAHYIGIIFLTRVILSIRLQDYQLKWRKAMSGYEEDDESNFSWRLKLWFLPHE